MNDKQLIEHLRLTILGTIVDGNYSMEFICNSVFLSRSQLHRRIKSITGLSTTNYVRKVRLTRAKELLQSKSENRINEVAVIVGINSPQNFSKYFKQEYGITPSDYKRTLATNIDRPGSR